MKKTNQLYITFTTLFLIVPLSINASELVYKPINPSFGGNPINGSYLLGKANAQNKHKAPVAKKSYAEKFQESLERAYISKMVREITDLAFGEEADSSLFGEDSIFSSGDYEILVLTSNPDAITVQITNTITGEITVIEIPRFG
ncbi:curli assembly protein CsgF [Pseudoalteromonas denitrificans]|uniref:Curli production assembly/transport component CsgF n=1 Tax=Pseudoalteromonas denitrificans DSM 6059 TaxID=1123010 RepID=A0A1I1UH12_9GAMM|nr:curli assembly protein CsgF [Pseudoalteromonas denitrificans]SFD70152.1 curli production assembly/transport component CsgF [Pseudoalteromonas denitrificans DSM 6059]